MQEKNSVNQLLLIASLIIVSSIATFIAGFYTNSLIAPQKQSPHPSTSSEPQSTDTPEALTTFTPGKQYFSDTIFVINKSAPHQTLIATVNRGQGIIDYSQNTRVSYFDGQNWNRELQDNTNESAAIFTNRIIKKWNIDIDPSRVLKEKVSGSITFKNQSLSFTTNEMQNEMAMRSIPGYTKFQSHTDGTLTVNGIPQDAYILYTRIYSLNASDIQFYNQPLGVTTEWLAFWAQNGDFYHVDKTDVKRKTNIYESHALGLKVDKFNTVAKVFDVKSSRDNDKDPKKFDFSFGQPISESIQTDRLNLHNKAPAFTYVWQMSQIEGTITATDGYKISGFGIMEYIKD